LDKEKKGGRAELVGRRADGVFAGGEEAGAVMQSGERARVRTTAMGG
jgi:hypothetical protein